MEITEKIPIKDFEELLQSHPASLVYFYQDKCGVCKVLFPKVQELLEKEFPKMEMIVIEAAQNRELAAQLRMLAVPGVMVFFDGKEFFRSNGLTTITELNFKISRLYAMFF